MPNVGPRFYQKLLQVANNVGMKPEDILNVMQSESGISTSAHNPGGGASGLLQMMPATLKGLGFKGTPADYRSLPGEEQLIWSEKLIRGNMALNGGKPFRNAAQFYISNWLPVALTLPGVQQEDQNTIIVAKDPDRPHLPHISTHMEQVYYTSNPGLDFNKDGVITYGDIVNVTKRNAANKNYLSALSQMQDATGYQPSAKPSDQAPPSMVATKDDPYQKYLSQFKGQNDNALTPAVNQVLEQYLHQIAASEKNYKKLYKKYLPANHMTIQIAASSFMDAVEFARVLCSVLDTELLATAFTHTNGRRVEVECSIPGPEEECLKAAEYLTESTAQAFETATRKIGGIKITTKLLMNKKSSYQQISLDAAECNYRKFLLKFV